jgi:hypothetical protein
MIKLPVLLLFFFIYCYPPPLPLSLDREASRSLPPTIFSLLIRTSCPFIFLFLLLVQWGFCVFSLIALNLGNQGFLLMIVTVFLLGFKVDAGFLSTYI